MHGGRLDAGLLIGGGIVAALTVWAAIETELSFAMLGALLAAVGAVVWLKRLDGWRRLYALALGSLIAGGSSFGAVASLAFYGRYIAVAALVAWTLQAHRSEKVPLSECPPMARRLVRGLWSLTVLAATSVVWSYDPGMTAQQALALGLLAALTHLLVTRRWTVQERIGGDLRVAYLVLVGAATASIAAQTLGYPEASAFNGRLQGVFSNPNLLGMAIVLAVPLGWGAYRETRRTIYLLGLLPVLYALVLSGSRTAQLAAGVAAAWLLLRAAWQPRYTFAVGSGALVAGALLPFFIDKVRSLIGATEGLSRFLSSTEGGAFNSRDLAWKAAINEWEQQPWLGWGYQAGEALFTDRFGMAGFFFSRPSVHNSYLQLLLELGLVGAAVLAFLMVLVAAGILRSPLSGANIGAIGVLVAGLVVHMTESAIFGTGQVYPFVYWLAAAAALVRYPAREKPAAVDATPVPREILRAQQLAGRR